jgi:hypothetical protein
VAAARVASRAVPVNGVARVQQRFVWRAIGWVCAVVGSSAGGVGGRKVYHPAACRSHGDRGTHERHQLVADAR